MTHIALITGGNRGLGRSYALALAAAGTDIVITYRGDESQAAAVVDEIEQLGRVAVALKLDTTEIARFDDFAVALAGALRDTWQRDSFDFLVNNAGVGYHAAIADTTVEQFDELFGVHVRGVYFLTQKLLPLLADGGRILNFSTGLARFVNGGGYAAYAAAKGAVEVFTRYLAQEVAPRGITANVIAPGPIATEFAGGALQSDEVGAFLGGQTAMGRIGRPDDVAGVVVALLTGGTGWVTAQRIEVSGGMLL